MIFSVKDLGRSPGSMRTIEEHVPAPKDFGVALIGVQEGSDMELDLRLEAVHEGILVSGTADVEVSGECGRCLIPLEYTSGVEIQELFYYGDSGSLPAEDEEDLHRVENDSIDLEPVLRDAVVTSLPFQPVCREDCKGLCSECGARLNDEPDHHHEILDPRWSALAGLTGTAAENDAAPRTESDEREES
ncbi:YceD family protein [Arthrobacter zhaoguopingii]|uniref:YceD family protein n=1 Tax=Arthrobacter zhaoguopingii TaxID=2681491 RepID=UPI001359E447|nr:YceD family protein [Arthrobacter zhaoguopingii]